MLTLCQNIKEIRGELEETLSRSFDMSRGIAVYGAGETATRYSEIFTVDTQNTDKGFAPIEPMYFIDDTPEKQGTTFLGKPVINYEQARELCKGYVILVCSGYTRSRKIIFDKLKDDPIADSDHCGFQEYFFCVHKDKVLTVFDMLEDDFSKASYSNAILLRMGKRKMDPALVAADSYFELPAFRTFDAKETFVDCGAYAGDTIEEYLKSHINFKRIVAFEPEKSNFSALTYRMNRLRHEWNLSDDQVELVYGGVGEATYRAGRGDINQQIENGVPHSGIRLSQMNSSNGESVPVYALDEYFADYPISFLKADIEGYEWNMLSGGEKVIKRDAPKIAISLYHVPADMFRLMIKIKDICPEYKFVIRHQQASWYDTILFAYVEKEYWLFE